MKVVLIWSENPTDQLRESHLYRPSPTTWTDLARQIEDALPDHSHGELHVALDTHLTSPDHPVRLVLFTPSGSAPPDPRIQQGRQRSRERQAEARYEVRQERDREARRRRLERRELAELEEQFAESLRQVDDEIRRELAADWVPDPGLIEALGGSSDWLPCRRSSDIVHAALDAAGPDTAAHVERLLH